MSEFQKQIDTSRSRKIHLKETTIENCLFDGDSQKLSRTMHLSMNWKEKTCEKIVRSHNSLNIIYNSYMENSLKTCERDRTSEKDPLEIINTKLQSAIPVHAERFWSSDQSKESIQALSRNYFIEETRKSNKHLILSSCEAKYNDIKNASEVRNVTFDRRHLALKKEEADQRIIPRPYKTVTEGFM